MIGGALWELIWWGRRVYKRRTVHAQAQALARQLGKPLVVVGASDRGATQGAGCGDVTIDILPSSCPNAMQADITKPLPFADNSCVVFVSYVLEYVDDYAAAMRELMRISGGNLFIIRVEPWTLTSYVYPGTRRRLVSDVYPPGAT